ncbi:rhomboid family intramembrane serine protease GlpG [Enterovibrio paralichthyis]|uniref:rhomboid family intramembrane serine protease GlpG n=1 Tax=Enterovibrio paralichthyis TaxID=2853805 RepID=UPI001C45482E|nr:rhomboid family intramembrane serine protease GlpG [Enterovibrio paralichthyis]MBV7298677.1 rhomboid family intramembrane serine protease GlpG [Enterovibrio paralichthyis]
MVRLIALSNPRAAQAFIDYMASRNIDIKLMPEGEGQFALWLADSQLEVEAHAELEAFLQNPMAEKYQAASWDMAESRTARFYYPRQGIMASLKQNSGPFTLFIMVVCIVVYAGLTLGFGNDVFSLLHFPAGESQQWQLWRLFTHALLHFSATHIIFNLLWWWVLGGRIEKQSGSAKLMQLFLLTALFSGLGQYVFDGPAFGGMSGVVYALLGYLWLMGTLAPERGLSIEPAYVGFMLLWLVVGFFEPFGMAIANMAHLFGLVSGCAIGLFDAKLRKAT